LIQLNLPKLWHHLDYHKIPVTLATLNWFLTGFISVLPLDICFRIWDLFFFYGNQVFFWVALALFRFMEPLILKMTSSGEIYTLFIEYPNQVNDADRLIEHACRFQKTITPRLIYTFQKKYQPIVKKQIEDFQKQLADTDSVDQSKDSINVKNINLTPANPTDPPSNNTTTTNTTHSSSDDNHFTEKGDSTNPIDLAAHPPTDLVPTNPKSQDNGELDN